MRSNRSSADPLVALQPRDLYGPASITEDAHQTIGSPLMTEALDRHFSNNWGQIDQMQKTSNRNTIIQRNGQSVISLYPDLMPDNYAIRVVTFGFSKESIAETKIYRIELKDEVEQGS